MKKATSVASLIAVIVLVACTQNTNETSNAVSLTSQSSPDSVNISSSAINVSGSLTSREYPDKYTLSTIQPILSTSSAVLSSNVATSMENSSSIREPEESAMSKSEYKSQTQPGPSISETVSTVVSSSTPIVSSSSEISVSSMESSTASVTHDATAIANRFLELLNVERAKLGYSTLTTSSAIHQIALIRSDELTVLFSHTRPNGKDSRTIYQEYQYGNRTDWAQIPGMEEFGIEYKPLLSGENIAKLSIGRKSDEELAQRLIEIFQGSNGHWTDLTRADYTAAGIGITLLGGCCYCSVEALDKLYR